MSWRGCCFVDVVRGFDFRPPAVLAHEIFTGRLERFSSAYKRALPPVLDIANDIIHTYMYHSEPDASEAYGIPPLYSYAFALLSDWPLWPACYIYTKTSISTLRRKWMAPKAIIINQLGKRRRSPPVSGRST